MKKSLLYKALCDFKGAQGATDAEKELSLASSFRELAKAFFYSGHFVVNEGEEYEYRIYITFGEFYYHEDDGLQDPRKDLQGKDAFCYEFGAVMPHWYGIDILFDDVENEKYHVSFFIKEFMLVEDGKEPVHDKTCNIGYSLFGGANMLRDGEFRIKWVDEEDTDYLSKPLAKSQKRKFGTEEKCVGDDRLWQYSIK